MTNKIDSFIQTREVSMKQKKQKKQPLLASRLREEAPSLADTISASQRHFLKVAATYGKELEPDGWLAGGGT